MRQEDERRRHLLDDLLQCRCVPVRGVPGQHGMVDGDHLLHFGGGELGSDAVQPGSRQHDGYRLAVRDLLRGGDGLPGGAIQLAATVLRDHHDEGPRGQITLASSLSLRTSSFAASAGEPSMIWVFFPFSGTFSWTIFCRGETPAGAATVRMSFFLAAM